jgi:hypothetical protein
VEQLSQDSRRRFVQIWICFRKREPMVVVSRLWQCGQVLQQLQAVRQGVRRFRLMDDGCEGIDVVGIRPVSGIWSVGYVLCCMVVAVADNAARATVCANVMVVGDAGIASFAVVLELDESAELQTGIGTAGLPLLLRFGSFLQTFKCLLKADAAVVARRRWQ